MLQPEEAVRSGPGRRRLDGHIQGLLQLLTLDVLGTVWLNCAEGKIKDFLKSLAFKSVLILEFYCSFSLLEHIHECLLE